jgi:4-amino-4-deoxy-L-arabinose transferase-like glycosyltransferase
LLLVGNDVTKAFFWSPHTQLFNVLVPVLALNATLRVLDGAAFDRTFALGLGLAVGLGLTAYGVFVVVPTCLMLPWLWALTREPSRARRRHALANLALLLALSIAPMALWYSTWFRRRANSFISRRRISVRSFGFWRLWSRGASCVVFS